MAVAARRASAAVGLVGVLVGVLVVLLHQRVVVPALLGVRGEPVAVLPGPLVVVVVFVGRHQAALLGRGQFSSPSCVVALLVFLTLFKIK